MEAGCQQCLSYYIVDVNQTTTILQLSLENLKSEKMQLNILDEKHFRKMLTIEVPERQTSFILIKYR